MTGSPSPAFDPTTARNRAEHILGAINDDERLIHLEDAYVLVQAVRDLLSALDENEQLRDGLRRVANYPWKVALTAETELREIKDIAREVLNALEGGKG